MSMKHLGTPTLDIHAGGRDFIFPHHENEIAQSEALTGQTFAKIWLHHGLLTINNQKMAKSLGNFITVQDALKKHSPEALKLFFLSTHYASSIDYTEDKLADMEKGVAKFRALIKRAADVGPDKIGVKVGDVEFLVEAQEKILQALDADFNTAGALGHLFDLVTAANRFLDAGKQDDYFEGSVHQTIAFLTELVGGVLGISLVQTLSGALSVENEALLAQRVQARLRVLAIGARRPCWNPVKTFVRETLQVDEKKEQWAWDRYDPAALQEIIDAQREVIAASKA
jgi:cysteinyl-tRNA synthetase